MTKPVESSICWEDYVYYDESSPSCLRWKVSRGRVKAGSIAGTLDSKNQWTIKFNSFSYRAHRVVYILHYELIPEEFEIDHKDRNPQNNKICNLRAITHGENVINRVPKQANTTGFRGVHLVPSGRYKQVIGINGITKHIGTFKTQEEAARAYDKSARELHKNFAILNFPENLNDNPTQYK